MFISSEEFDEYVCRAIELLDPAFRQYLDEVPVIVEDFPDQKVCRQMGLKNKETLLGLFHGVPLDKRSVGAVGGPNQIVLYRQNILKFCRSKRHVAEQIRKTLIHELGHYLGFSEEELRKYRY
jgi:predicted Zn-dependent protease with MMP-like domain